MVMMQIRGSRARQLVSFFTVSVFAFALSLDFGAAMQQSTGLSRERLMLQELLNGAGAALSQALMVPVDSKNCDSKLAAAIAAVNDAQQQLISAGEIIAARGNVTVARQANSQHLDLLRVTKLSSSQTRRALYSLNSQADKTLKEAEAQLSAIAATRALLESSGAANTSQKHIEGAAVRASSTRIPSSEGVDFGSIPDALNEVSNAPCSGNAVDGTVCQFSQCAKGRGLVSCAVGFAKGVVGGYHGPAYTVTSDEDEPTNPPAGTLRYGLNLARNHPGGVWITFSRDMIIELRGMLWIHSRTTIDGRGFNVSIHKHSMVMSGAADVILENFQISTVRGGDTVHIFAGCSRVWVDHLTSFGGDLGLVSVLQGSTDVTISNSRLQNQNFNMLLGASDNDEQDKNLRVSVYRNHFVDSMQRMPHCRWGWCHAVNNVYTNWGYYAIGARVNARVKTENNVFFASRTREVTPWHSGATASSFDMTARIESTGDLLLNGATFHQFLDATHDVTPPYPAGSYPPVLGADRVNNLVQNCAGNQTPKTFYFCQRASQ